MAAITNYTTLAAAIPAWDKRSYTADVLDEIIGLADAEFRLELGPLYPRETTATLSFVSGSASFSSRFIRPLALIVDTYGRIPFRSSVEVKSNNASGLSGVPVMAAVDGDVIITYPAYTGDADFVYEAQLTGISTTNATNWIIAHAPQAYLKMCLYVCRARIEDYESAALFKADALDTVSKLNFQSMVATTGMGGMTIAGPTP